MQGPAWIELIKRIPPGYHDGLVAVTSTGAEIMVQRIMRLEAEFMILRGRPAGSTEEARIVLLPWDELNHVAFGKSLPEKEIQAIFGNGECAVEAAAEPVAKDAVQEPAAAPAQPSPAEPKDTLPTAAPAAAKPAAKPAPLSKTVLLARLRARMANDSKAK